MHNNEQDMASLERKQPQSSGVPLQLGHVLMLLKKGLDEFLGLFLNPYSLDIKG